MEQSQAQFEVQEGLAPLLPRLWQFGVTLSGSRQVAEDIVQAACVRALERAEQYSPGTRLDSWVFSIMASIWKNQMRSDAVRRGAGQLDASEALGADPSAGPESKAFANQVLRAVGALPEAQRAAVVLVYVEGFSYKEAAKILEIPIGTVMSRLAAAKKSLRHLRDGVAARTPSTTGGEGR